jgi:DNA-binding MarR family transcriptional regulator
MTKVAKKKPKNSSGFKVELDRPTGSLSVRYNNVTKVHPGLKSYFCYCLHKAAIMHKAQVEKDLSVHGIAAHHLAVLGVIEMSEKISQNHVAEELGIDKASMVKLVDFLEQKELIERRQSAQDRRVNFLVLTPKGKKTFQKGTELTLIAENNALEGFSEEEQNTIKEFLLRILDRGQ